MNINGRTHIFFLQARGPPPASNDVYTMQTPTRGHSSRPTSYLRSNSTSGSWNIQLCLCVAYTGFISQESPMRPMNWLRLQEPGTHGLNPEETRGMWVRCHQRAECILLAAAARSLPPRHLGVCCWSTHTVSSGHFKNGLLLPAHRYLAN